MLFYEQYKKLLTEATFRKSKQVKHLFDLPMFSVFAHKELNDELVNSLNTPEIKNIFKRARNTIAKMGFTSMHSNVMFRDLSDRVNINTGGKVGGFAHITGKYMTLDPKVFFNNTEYAHDIIVHEWAHLYMFNNSKGFNNAVKEFYNQLLSKGKLNTTPKLEPKLPETFESQVFKQLSNVWVPMIERLFTTSGRGDWQVDKYIEAYNKLSINDVEYLPHLATIHGKSKRKFGNVDIGDNVYADKFGGGWFLGNANKQRSSRSEIQIPFDELLNYLDISVQEAETQFNQVRIPKLNKIELKKYVYQYIEKQIERALEQSMKNLNYQYKYKIENSKEFINTAASILLPPVLKYLRNIVKIPNLGYKVYDKVWSNPANGKVSYMKEISKNILNIINTETELNFKNTKNLSGEQYNDVRKAINNLVDWVDEYGMSNDDEIWATGIQYFFKLNPQHRKSIIKLMTTTGARTEPNRSQRRNKTK